ncbi:MAG: type II toxin-antitoxin system RelE/ParE family toxin [Synergistaceae bacterium]|nr:type II toxin-antitoxin system RelE/ParE family toxin [Synergistaceae bacterium]MBQ7268140.1 type II toxin-antitoxin system RelE/ParE family toxin [Synergistaceae bacterium]
MGSIFSVKFIFEARQDMHNICHYIKYELNDPVAAADVADKITASAISLSLFPKRYRVRKKDSKGQEIRIMPVNNFALIYSVDEAKQIVNILRVIYSRRNLDALI